MSTSNLSPEAAKKLLALQQELRQFLKQFGKLEDGSTERAKHILSAKSVKDLYVSLTLVDLKEIASSAAPDAADVQEEESVEVPKTKKEARKARREARKAARKGEKSERKAERRESTVVRKAQNEDKSGAKEESLFRYDNLKEVWANYEFDKITSNFRSYLDEGEKFLTDAQNFIDYAQSFAPGIYIEQIEEIEALIVKAEKFLVIARNLSEQVDRYAKIAQDVVNMTLSLPSKAEDLKDGIVAEATKIFAAAKSFIATADLTDEDIQLNVETLEGYLARGEAKLGRLEDLVGVVIGDEDGDNLPDWYNRLEVKFNELLGNGSDLIPGTKIDDKILIQITGLKKSVDKFIAAASDKVEALGLQEKIQNAQQWLSKLSEFTSAITGFVENVKDGDLAAIYEDLKDFKDFIDSDEDLLEGTSVDNKIKAKLQEYSEKARTWLMNKLTGGDPDKTGEVRSILGAIDKLILSTGGVVDHSSKYEKDENRISVPEINAVSKEEMAEVLEKYGIRKKDSSFEGILSDMKDQADEAKDKVGLKFKDAALRGSQASAAFRDAKEEYDQSVTKHNDYFKATNSLGKKIISGLLSVAGVGVDSFLPGAGSVIGAVGSALLGEFDEVNSQIDKVMPEGFDFIGDLAKDILPGVLPSWGSERGIIQIEGKELLAGLNELYMNGISSRYQDVMSLLNGIKAKSSSLGKNLRTLEQADTVDEDKLAEIKENVIILEMKWAGLKKDILKKYINLPYPPINEKKAYQNASRYLYSVWLIRFPQKEIRIAEAMIKQFEKFGIMSESKAEWDTGFWASAGRGFFGFFGGDPFDYRAELKKMKAWASSENDTLKSAQAWAEVF
ncbi:MAG: Unknown protein [uncultured Aureispira sp.]|uniref:Uncharacterized protein n=1 Tax=uncultured Aureispira sp. TaxID=1331704 RepID=A0A6S6UI10_9BACT|nr:MAG: Unknown protein [uncultured Aureispira sp.]